MALAFDHEIGTNNGAVVSSLAITAGAAVAQYDLIVVVSGNLIKDVSTATDSKGNTYTVVQQIDDGSFARVGVAFASAVTALANTDTITVTFSGADTAACVEACCFSGFTNHAPTLDQASAEAHGTSTAPASASVTTAVAAEVAVGAVAYNGTGTFTAGTGFTKTAATPISSGTALDLAVEWQILASTQTLNAAGTLGTSRTWECGIVTFYDLAVAAARERGLLGVGT